MSTAKVLVVVALVGAVVFGLFIGYLAYSNDSFPAQTRPFASYAKVVYSSFNSTEYAFRVEWNSSNYVPLFTQLTSPTTDAANTPVCDLKMSSVESGETIFLPFTISPESATLSNVDLAIAVRSATNSTQFTIIYNVPLVRATNTPISPSNITCQQPLVE